MFDPKKPKSKIVGLDGTYYLQDGKKYSLSGKPLSISTRPEYVEPKVSAEPEAAKDEPSTSVDYDKMHWYDLRRLVVEAGGTYTTKKAAIEFLNDVDVS